MSPMIYFNFRERWPLLAALAAGMLLGMMVAHIYQGRSEFASGAFLPPSECGVVDLSDSGESFVFSCSSREGEGVKDLSQTLLPPQVECSVFYAQSGHPDQFNCRRAKDAQDAVIRDEENLSGHWVCEGLVPDVLEATIRFEEGGKFRITVPAVAGTLNVWRIADADIYGSYTRSKNGRSILLVPEGMTNDVIESAGLAPSEAPEEFLQKQQWDLRVFDRDLLRADAINPDELSQWIKVVGCRRPPERVEADDT